MQDVWEERVFLRQRAIRRRILDRHGMISHAPARTLAAQLLLYLDDPVQCWQIGVDWLRHAVGAERVGGGTAEATDVTYFPAQYESLVDSKEIPSLKGIRVYNSDEGMRLIWRSRRPIVFANIASGRYFSHPVQRALVDRGVTTKIATALRSSFGSFAVIGADRVKCGHQIWRCSQYEIFESVVAEVLSPVLGAAKELQHYYLSDQKNGGGDRLTAAEMRVARLTARGYSYKEIARTLGRSPHTIDHQLRSIRVKLCIPSQAKLVSYLIRRMRNSCPQ